MSTPVVLIADDSMVVRAFLKKQLASEEYQLVEAESGETALELCRKAKPDVVLLDVEMPGLSGYDVITEMQADPELSGIPVIFLSGRVSANDVATGLRLGAHDYLRKPVEAGELIARVTNALRTKAMFDKLHNDTAAKEEVIASMDDVTGVLSTDGLRGRLRELVVTLRNGRALAAVLVDINHLADINQQHGHDMGDQVLRAVATVVGERIGPRDIVGRCGPDEFLVLLPDTNVREGETLAAAVNEAVEHSPALGAGALGVGVTVAIAATTTGDLEALFRELEQGIAAGKAAAAAPQGVAAPTEDPGNPDGEIPGAPRRRWMRSGR